MNRRAGIGRVAMRAALELRRSQSISRDQPLNIFDFSASVGLEVRFLDAPSLEGMFARDPNPLIVLPSLNHRPYGRVAYTCGHELGHFHLGHGTRVDEYIRDRYSQTPVSDEEFAANTFASTLLMTRQAVLSRFAIRNIEPVAALPVVLFEIAAELGVGYQTLLTHMTSQLEVVSTSWSRDRSKVSPKDIKLQILGGLTVRRLVIVGNSWPMVPIDLEIGDCLVVPERVSVTPCALLTEASCKSGWRAFLASRVGRSLFVVDGANLTVRIARHGYCGKLSFRYLEEPEDE